MSSKRDINISKENLDFYLKEVAKEYRRMGGKIIPAEIILVGGASIVANYGFRDMTTDVDAIIQAASSMKDAINKVRDEYNLPNGWLNADFMKTDSYSRKLSQYSIPYKSFYSSIHIRTITAEYLIAMKLRSGRKYKNDLSDVVGILAEHKKNDIDISIEKIIKAVEDLYGNWDILSNDSKEYITNIFKDGNFEKIYKKIVDEEKEAKNLLVTFENDYPKVLDTDNVNQVLETLKRKKK